MVIVFAAGIVRGWSGFAFALVAGAGLTFLMPPQIFVPVSASAQARSMGFLN
ncbi:MAG: hypothetical protein ACOH12_06670 [Parvibaculaceae bacterium]